MKCVESFCQPESELRTNQLFRMSKFDPPTWAGHFALVEGLLRRIR